MEIDEIRLIRDRQRSKCYTWETDLITDKEVPISEAYAEETFQKLCKLFKVEGKLIHSKRLNGANQRTGNVRIGPTFLKMSYLCHEFAHLVVWWYIERNDEGGELEPHGVEWLTVYMILLNKTCGLSFEQLTQSADSSKLRYDINLLRKHIT